MNFAHIALLMARALNGMKTDRAVKLEILPARAQCANTATTECCCRGCYINN